MPTPRPWQDQSDSLIAIRHHLQCQWTCYGTCYTKLLVTLQSCSRGVRHGAPRRTRFRNPLDFTWISDFRMDFWISKWISGFQVDFWISKWISGFQSGFLDFKVDFWISKWISGFQSGFLDFKRISGFHLNRYYSERTAKYTHDS